LLAAYAEVNRPGGAAIPVPSTWRKNVPVKIPIGFAARWCNQVRDIQELISARYGRSLQT
jgi:hypothetical protein